MIGRNTIIQFLFYAFCIYEINCNDCNINIKIAQKLYKSGYHRNITYTVDLSSDENNEKWTFGECLIGLEQSFPTGVFISPDEIIDHKCRDLVEFIFKTPINIEQPAEYAHPIWIHLITKVHNSRSQIYFPVHARYQNAVKGGGMARNVIEPPRFFLNCPGKKLYTCSFPTNSSDNSFCKNTIARNKCRWKEVPATMVTDRLFWDVPVGNTEHYYVVLWGTLIAIVVGSLYLFKTIHDYKNKIRIIKKKKT